MDIANFPPAAISVIKPEHIPLTDLGIRAESNFEAKLSACLMLYPTETLGLCNGLKFRVNVNAKRFWDKAYECRDAIENSIDEYQAISKILLDLQIPLLDQLGWFSQIVNEDRIAGQYIHPVDRIVKAMSDLEATRGTAIWLQYMQKNHIFDQVRSV